MQTKDQVAARLAETHYRIERSIRHIFRLRDRATEGDRDDPVKLLEVNEATVPGGILPVYFGPYEPAGLTFPSIIIDVTPDEFDQMRARQLSLPNGWELAEELPRPEPE